MNKLNLIRFDSKRDLLRLFNYMMNEKNQALFSSCFQIKTIDEFEKWLSAKLNLTYHDFFMIRDNKGRVLGFTFSYEFFQYDGHCKFTLCLYEEFQKIGFGVLAGAAMLNYLFSKYPLRQIFISVYGYNHESLAVNRKSGFTELGILPNYRYYNGSYHPLHLLVISRETFYDKNSKFLCTARKN